MSADSNLAANPCPRCGGQLKNKGALMGKLKGNLLVWQICTNSACTWQSEKTEVRNK